MSMRAVSGGWTANRPDAFLRCTSMFAYFLRRPEMALDEACTVPSWSTGLVLIHPGPKDNCGQRWWAGPPRKAQGRGEHGFPDAAGQYGGIDLAAHLLDHHEGLDHADAPFPAGPRSGAILAMVARDWRYLDSVRTSVSVACTRIVSRIS
jgi:hypothetical protein